jgi:ubiquinol-cytochrome c reductase cytochrome b subunit
MMIHLAKDAERKAKLAKASGPKKVSEIKLSIKWTNWMLVALLAFQVFLNIAAYNAFLSGMNNVNLWITGVILITFAGFFHLYRYALSEEKNAPPPPPIPVPEEKPKLAEPEVSVEQSKLPEGEKTSDAKELAPEVPIPKTQADVRVATNNNSNIGANDIDGVKKL